MKLNIPVRVADKPLPGVCPKEVKNLSSPKTGDSHYVFPWVAEKRQHVEQKKAAQHRRDNCPLTTQVSPKGLNVDLQRLHLYSSTYAECTLSLGTESTGVCWGISPGACVYGMAKVVFGGKGTAPHPEYDAPHHTALKRPNSSLLYVNFKIKTFKISQWASIWILGF